MSIPLMNQTPPVSIQLLIELWEADDRFVPHSVCGWSAGDYKPATPADWRWSGGMSQSGGDAYLREFHTWTKLDQQTLLETALGKIFSVGSEYHKTVIQLHGTTVSVKHRDLKLVRRFSVQPTMIGNLFQTLITMVKIKWLPMHKSKDGRYYYSGNDKATADTAYQIEAIAALKKAMSQHQDYLNKPSPILPTDDPFSGSQIDH